MNTTTEKVSVSGYVSGQVTISGLTEEEQEAFLASMRAGAHLVRNEGGRLQIIPAYTPFPNPVEDKEMAPFWRMPTPEQLRRANEQLTLINLDELPDYSSPSIHISSLCGYNYSPENYKHHAGKLQSWGFFIMRSPRGTDGQYWEIWYLPALWAAKGELKNCFENVEGNDEKEKLKLVLEFLRVNSSFGSLDVSVQKLCMRAPD